MRKAPARNKLCPYIVSRNVKYLFDGYGSLCAHISRNLSLAKCVNGATCIYVRMCVYVHSEGTRVSVCVKREWWMSWPDRAVASLKFLILSSVHPSYDLIGTTLGFFASTVVIRKKIIMKVLCLIVFCLPICIIIKPHSVFDGNCPQF